MTDVLHDTLRTLRTSPVFAFYLLATLAAAGVIALITFDIIDLGMNHFGEPTHRTHDVVYGALFTTTVVGVAVQLRRPHRNPAGMAMALVPVAALMLAGLLAGDWDPVVVRNPLRYAAAVAAVAAVIHPAGRAFVRSFALSRIDPTMLGLAGVAAVPLLAFAATNVDRQRTATDMHAVMGHYGFMAALCFTVVAVGLLASLRPVGWRLAAWATGALAAVLGVTSILFPEASSSLGNLWAAATVAWGAGFVAAAARVTSTPARARREDPRRPAASSRAGAGR